MLQLVTLLLITMLDVLAHVTSLSTKSVPLPSEVETVENITAAMWDRRFSWHLLWRLLVVHDGTLCRVAEARWHFAVTCFLHLLPIHWRKQWSEISALLLVCTDSHSGRQLSSDVAFLQVTHQVVILQAFGSSLFTRDLLDFICVWFITTYLSWTCSLCDKYFIYVWCLGSWLF